LSQQWAIDLENELDEGRAKLVTMASEDAAVAREVNQARYGVQASLVDVCNPPPLLALVKMCAVRWTRSTAASR